MSTGRFQGTTRPYSQHIDFSWKGYDCQCNNREEHQSQSILRASWDRDLDKLQMLLSEGIPFDINYRGKPNHEHEKWVKPTGMITHGYTPLQAAVYNNFTAGMKLLIENNADVNSIIPNGYFEHVGQSALSIALSYNMRKYHTDETVDQVRMLLGAGADAPDIMWHINIVARLLNHGPYLQNPLVNLAILELVFTSMSDEVVEGIIPTHVPGIVKPSLPWSDEALDLLRFHQGRRARGLEQNNLTFALSLHPRAVRHGTIPSQLDKEIAWKIMEYVCPERPANGRR